MNQTPSSERIHIAFFGRRNVGKSSLVNAFTGQRMSLVSDVKGTTTDPVSKAMELLPLGPVQIIDTPGFDDVGDLGQLRIQRTLKVFTEADIVILVTDATQPLCAQEKAFLEKVRRRGLPHLLVRNKADLTDGLPREGILTSALTGQGIEELKKRTAALTVEEKKRPLVSDLLSPGDLVVLVVPIDKSAPKGRLILPQQQTIRDILDAGAGALVCRETELETTLADLPKPPKLVITDSQVFDKVDAIVPDTVPLTSFSILMARYKGDLPLMAEGIRGLENLKDGDRILIAEGCTHHRQCEDIGTVKLPRLLRRHTGIEPEFVFVSGRDFPEDLSAFKWVIHCGGCMQTHKQLQYRLEQCREAGIPVTNYGLLLAHLNGILERAMEPVKM
jgi:[FeFe] hydrogenase H-cluster maturation GTPase HydF